MGEEDKATFQREREVFFAALGKITGAARQSFLEDACGGDVALLDRVSQMLDRHLGDDSDTFMIEVPVRAGFAVPAGGRHRDSSQSRFTPPDPADISSLIDGFEIVDLLGVGGMGAVYKARQPKLDRFVAVKLLPESWGTGPEFGERFLREAKTLAKLDHPNIVTVHDVGEAGGYFYFVMEFIDGVDLSQMMKAERLAISDAVALISQICDALEYAHGQGVVHRDIKPANILVNKNGQAKIADFGIAKILNPEPTSDSLTRTDVAMGTPRYMAPEQLDSPLAVDHRADIYAVGVLFYEMLTGEFPVGNFKVPSKKIQIDARIDEVVLRALAKEPELRYQRVSEIKEDVKKATATDHRKESGARRRGSVAGVAAATVLSALAIWAAPRWFATKPHINSLGMQFVEVPDCGVQFSIWETRVGDFETFVEDTGHLWNRPDFAQRPDEPAAHISFDDAQAFCDWLTEKEQKAGILKKGERYRLPTDSEWSAAVGLGSETGTTPETRHGKIAGVYPWGTRAPAPAGAGNYPDTALKKEFPASTVIPGYYDGFATTAPVGSFSPNQHGIYDLGGNLSEWTNTPFSEGNSNRVLRGGSWWNSFRETDWNELLSSWRRHDIGVEIPGLHLKDIGFRPVLEPAQADGGRPDRDPGGLLGAAGEGDLARATELLKSPSADLDESDPEGVTALMLAARHGSIPVAKLLLDRGADIEATDQRGTTALIHAVAGRQPGTVRLLLERGARIMARDNSGADAATKAIVTGQEEALSVLLDSGEIPEDKLSELFLSCINYGNADAASLLVGRGADLSKKDRLGVPILCSATLGGRGDIVALLLENGADPNLGFADRSSLTPLVAACMMGNLAVAELLLDHGAEVAVREGSEFIPLHIAATGGHADLVSLLLDRGADPLIKNGSGATALAGAAHEFATYISRQNSALDQAGVPRETHIRSMSMISDLFASKRRPGKRAIVRCLLDKGVPVDAPDSNGATPLNIAASNGSLEVVEELVASGAKIDARDNAGFSPLLSAAEAGHLAIVRHLHEAGADFSATVGKSGRNALHLAAFAGKLDLVAYLVGTGEFQIDAPDEDRLTALHMAARYGCADIARFLLENGAAPNFAAGTSGGYPKFTPLHFGAGGIEMLKGGYKDAAVSEAMKTGEPGAPPPLDADARDFLGVLQALLDRGADLEAPDGYGFSPLARAAWWNHTEAVSLLAGHGAKVNPQGAKGMTPLIYAAGRGNTRTVEALLALGADTTATDGHSATALHWCAMSGNESSALILVDGGAGLEARDLTFSTPLHKAAHSGNEKVVRALCEKGANPHARDLDGMTPAQRARASGNVSVADYLDGQPKP